MNLPDNDLVQPTFPKQQGLISPKNTLAHHPVIDALQGAPAGSLQQVIFLKGVPHGKKSDSCPTDATLTITRQAVFF
jgi:hypothetical protein